MRFYDFFLSRHKQGFCTRTNIFILGEIFLTIPTRYVIKYARIVHKIYTFDGGKSTVFADITISKKSDGWWKSNEILANDLNKK